MAKAGRIFFVGFVILAAAVGAAWAQDHPCATGGETSGLPAKGARPDRFVLQGREQAYRLAGLYAPEGKLAPGFHTLFSNTNEPDRHGRVAVQAFRDGNWVQGELLEGGKALVFGNISGNCLVAMKEAEHHARRADRGLWSDMPLKTSQVKQLEGKIGQFVVVKGRIISVGDRTNRVYLNFGSNWAQDFTASAAKKGRDKFGGDIDLLRGLQGKTVQVRGVLDEQRGPLIRLLYATQIEIIE